MNVLKVATRETQPGLYKVFYTTRPSLSLPDGVVDVHLNPEAEEGALIAEMAAIRFLICENHVLGGASTGSGLELHVSAGAIKKAALGTTQKKHLIYAAHFLATRLAAVNIEVSKNSDWVDAASAPPKHHTLKIDAIRKETLPSLIHGDVVISRHALDRMVERFIGFDILRDGKTALQDMDKKYWSRAWKTLERLLSSPDTILLKVPERQKTYWNKKYGNTHSALYHASSQAIFIIVRNRDGLELVTTLRSNEYDVLVPRPPVLVGDRLVRRVPA